MTYLIFCVHRLLYKAKNNSYRGVGDDCTNNLYQFQLQIRVPKFYEFYQGQTLRPEKKSCDKEISEYSLAYVIDDEHVV